ncbi:sensor histidine kinase [Bacillota bacterium Meth-B3]
MVERFREAVPLAHERVRSMKIRDRIFLALLGVLLLVLLVAYTMTRHAMRVYADRIDADFSRTLDMVSLQVDRDLRELEQLSLRVFGNQKLQDELCAMRELQNPLVRLSRVNKLTQTIMDSALEYDFIKSAGLIDGFYQLSRSGLYLDNNISAARIRQIADVARAGRGSSVWFAPVNGERYAVFARQIRKIKDLELTNLATLVFFIDMDSLLLKTGVERFAREDIRLLVFQGDELLFSSDNAIAAQDATIGGNGARGEQVIDGQRWLYTVRRSQYTGWRYKMAVPRDSVYREFDQMNAMYAGMFVALALLALALGRWFAGTLTRPLEALARRMQRVQGGDFTVDSDAMARAGGGEVGNLQRSFEVMIRAIDSLVIKDLKQQAITKDAQYRALQAQINPHFLYNTLDSVYWLAQGAGETQIAQMVHSLGALLRATIRADGRAVPLPDELQVLGQYVTIQKIRYQERLDVEMRVDDSFALAGWKVPGLMLQPLVENAIRHGIDSAGGVGRIVVSIEERSGRLHITVEDGGAGMDEALAQKLQRGEVVPKEGGLGLKNIIERLQILYGGGFSLEIGSRRGEGTRVHIILERLEGET